jgi:hypothetical protein
VGRIQTNSWLIASAIPPEINAAVSMAPLPPASSAKDVQLPDSAAAASATSITGGSSRTIGGRDCVCDSAKLTYRDNP